MRKNEKGSPFLGLPLFGGALGCVEFGLASALQFQEKPNAGFPIVLKLSRKVGCD
jgi:hypothetical protein